MDQPHLIEGLDRVTRALGGLTAARRSGRMATVVHPESGRVTASFAAVAKHYGVQVRPCRRGAATARAWPGKPTTARRPDRRPPRRPTHHDALRQRESPQEPRRLPNYILSAYMASGT